MRSDVMKASISFFFTVFAAAAAVVVLITSCGEKIPGADPDPIEKTVRFEVDGSVGSAEILTRDGSGELIHGEEDEDGTVTPETVDLPWEYEYEIDANQSNYYYIEAANHQTSAKTSGTTNTWHDTLLQDASAAFTSTVVPGYIAYNSTDDVFREVISVNDNTELTLSGCLHPTSVREYIIYQSGSVSGTTDGGGVGTYELEDSSADFISERVSVGDFVWKTSTSDYARITGVATTILTLDKDIFLSGHGYKLYSSALPASSSTQQNHGSLIDSTASFTTTVSPDDIVYNTWTGDYALVLSPVGSDTELDLDTNIFPHRLINYTVYQNRTLSCTVYVDDEEYITTSSTHWDCVEALLSGTIPADDSE